MPTSRTRTVADSYRNVLTGMGVSFTDSGQHWDSFPDQWLRQEQLDTLYCESMVAARIVDRLVDDATNVSWSVKNQEQGQEAGASWASIQAKAEELDVLGILAQTWKWSRLYGGAAVILAVADQRPHSKPLGAGRLIGLSAVDGSVLVPQEWDSKLGSAGFMNPISYRLAESTNDGKFVDSELIHASRVIRFNAIDLPPRLLMRSSGGGVGVGWGPSVLQRSHKSIRRLDTSLDNVDAILQKISILAVRMKDWNKTITGVDGVEKGQKILRNLMAGVSNLRMVGIDADDEIVEIKRSLDGIAEIVDKFTDAVVRESDQPRLVVLGESPPGSLGDRGSAEQTAWNNRTASARRKELTPALSRVLKLMGAPDEFTLDYEMLDDADPSQKAETELKEVQADSILINSTIGRPSEMRDRWIEAGKIKPAPIVLAPVAGAAPAAGVGEESISKQALTGIQITSLVELVQQVSSGILSDEATEIILNISFPTIPREQAIALITAAKTRGTPAAGGAPAPAGAPGAPPVAPGLEPSQDEVPADMISVQQAAARIGVPTRTITRAMELGALRWWGWGSRRNVSLADVIKLGASGGGGHEPQE